MPITSTHDRYGFPLRDCSRCGGTGSYSYCAMYGSTCFGCSGQGKQYVGKQHGEWRDAIRKAVRVITQDLNPGDTVRPWGQRPIPAGRTVVAIVDTGEPSGWSWGHRPDLAGVPTSQLPADVETSWYQLVTWDDGTTERLSGAQLWHREGVRIDPAPYVERALRQAERSASRRRTV